MMSSYMSSRISICVNCGNVDDIESTACCERPKRFWSDLDIISESISAKIWIDCFKKYKNDGDTAIQNWVKIMEKIFTNVKVITALNTIKGN